MYYAKKMNKTPIQKFIKSWMDKGITPKLEIIEECDLDILSEREIYWIKYFRDCGYSLLNLTDGGEGSIGRVTSDETKEKQSKAGKGKKYPGKLSSSSFKKGHLSWSLGVKFTAEHRANISKAKSGISKPFLMKPVASVKGDKYESITDAAKKNGITPSAILYHCKKFNGKFRYI